MFGFALGHRERDLAKFMTFGTAYREKRYFICVRCYRKLRISVR